MKKKQKGRMRKKRTQSKKRRRSSYSVQVKKRTNKKMSAKQSFILQFKLFSMVCVTVISLCWIVFSFLYGIKSMSGYGMAPTLNDRDLLLVRKSDKNISRFDLVFLEDGINEQITRIIGLPGEELYYENDNLLINSHVIDEKFIVDKINEYQLGGMSFTEDFSTVTLFNVRKIPENYYLVLSDNRPHVTDSRVYGLIHEDKIKGEVMARFWPLEQARKF